jgi:hypothetical protein
MTVTQPGLPRNFYNGHGKTEYCIGEAQRYVSEVVFTGATGEVDPLLSRPEGTMMPTGPIYENASPSGSTSYLPAPQPGGYEGGYNGATMPNINSPQPGMYEPTQPSPPQTFAASSQNHTGHSRDRSVDEFGVGSMGPLSPRLGMGPGGGRFATFPVKATTNRPGAKHRGDAPSLGVGSNRKPSLSFSSQVEQALNSPINPNFIPPKPGGTGFDDPVPVYEAESSPIYDPPPGPPPGSSAVPSVAPAPGAPPAMVNPWNEDLETEGNHTELEVPPRTSADEAGDIQLAYRSSASDLNERPPHRRVRFGSVSDVDEEMEVRRRQSEDGSGPEPKIQAVARQEIFDDGSIHLLMAILLNLY